MAHTITGCVDDLGDDSVGRNLEGVVAAISRHVSVARGVRGDAERGSQAIACTVAGSIDDLGDDSAGCNLAAVGSNTPSDLGIALGGHRDAVR